MKVYLNKSQIIFPKPEKYFDYYTLSIEKKEDSVYFTYEGWLHGETLPNYMASFPISLNCEISKAKIIISINNILTLIDDYGCQSLKIQAKSQLLSEIQEHCEMIGFPTLFNLTKIPK